MRALYMTLMLVCGVAQARSMEGVEFPDSVIVGENMKLVLNGVGLRSKRVALMKFKVYVAGLYASAATKSPEALLGNDHPRRLKIVFLRSLDKKTLMEAWKEGFEKNCGEDCDRSREALNSFNETMIDVDKGDEMTVDFLKDSVIVEVLAKKTTEGSANKKTGASAKIKNPAFAHDLLKVFIGSKPPTEELKKGLLGI